VPDGYRIWWRGYVLTNVEKDLSKFPETIKVMALKQRMCPRKWRQFTKTLRLIALKEKLSDKTNLDDLFDYEVEFLATFSSEQLEQLKEEVLAAINS